MNSSVFNDFLNSAKDVEERTASGNLPPVMARQVREITSAVDDKERITK